MRKALGISILGFCGGWLLSQLRAMPGGDLFAWPFASAACAMGLRAAAFVLIALALWKRREGLRWPLLLAVTFGYAASGLASGPRQGIPWLGLIVVAIAGWVSAGWVRPKETPPSSQDGAQPANVGEMLGLFVAGGGLAIAIESIARYVREFGSGLAQDDTIFGVAFLAFVALGTAAFGWLASTARTRRLSFPVLCAASAAACFASLSFIETVADPVGLKTFLDRWGVRPIDHGTLAFDLMLGAAAFVLPALLLGASLAGARGRRSLSSAVLGAALGLYLIPRFLDRGFGAAASQAETFTAQLVPYAVMATVGGAALAILSESRRRPIARYVALALALPCALVVLGHTIKPIFVLDPWSSRPILPYLAFDTPMGLATIENSVGGLKVASLARHQITPETRESASDSQRLRDSFALISPARRKEGSIQVLFVGQLSAFRANELTTLGATRIDRSAAWWKAMPRLEAALFENGDVSQNLQMPEGEVLSPDEARRRLADGKYDIVIAPPVPGDAPAIAHVDAPEKTVVVRWLRLDEPLRGVTAREPAVLSAAGLDMPALGIVTNASTPSADAAERPRTLPSSRFDMFVPTPLAWSLVREPNRVDKARSAAFQSLATSWHPAPTPFIKGLELHYSVQAPSSPFEKDEDRIEISDPALDQLKIDARGELDAFTRAMWEWIAGVLVGKRDVTRIEKYVAPVAAAHAPWSALEVSLAYADLESLDAPAAIARLEPVVARDPAAWRAWFALGEAREITGNASGSAAAFKHADDLLPGQNWIRRRFAMAACRAGDPAGRRVAQELLAQKPKDTQMQAFVAPGPPPPAPTSYQPQE